MQACFKAPGATETRLSAGWRLVLTDADAWKSASEIDPAAAFIAAPVPGTVAEALEQAGLFNRTAPYPLENRDAWYICRLADGEPGPAILRFAGLATVAEVYFNETLVLSADSMFEAHDVAVNLTGDDVLAICFRALGPKLLKTGPRARWRPQMMDSQGLRLIRTTALGHMPGWCPEIHAVGPWRPISMIRVATSPAGESTGPGKPMMSSVRVLGARRDLPPCEAFKDDTLTTAASAFKITGIAVSDLSIKARLDQSGDGVLYVSLSTDAPAPTMKLRCGGVSQKFEIDATGRYCAELRLPDAKPWWPRSHGEPHLYAVDLQLNGKCYSLGKTGFRNISIDRGADSLGFAVIVNGERIFCRGAVWTTADIVRLPGDRADYRPWLELAADAGMNMIRIGGTMAYETSEFFKLCDEMGLMVWQDLMLANFDYPTNDLGFVAQIEREVRQFLESVQASPSLAVVCGGSEIYQQGAMLGLPERIWKNTLCDEILPNLISRLNSDLQYVANSPSGGAMPFSPNAGVTHYYGVGAYCRPLDDARRANVRFATECLAFSLVPQQSTLDAYLPGVKPVNDPRWKARVPRDRGASWDFEDIRDHYLTELYGFDTQKLRREDPGQYLHFSRAVTAEVTEATFAEWRRPQSSCNGALVWTLQDLLPGAGWGLIDSSGMPKSVWYALKRAFRPVQVIVSDEGTNGLDVHVINEGAFPLALDLELACLRAGQQVVVSGRMELVLAARESRTFAATDLFGAFFDTTYAFRFGPPAHDVTVARLRAHSDGKCLADAFHFPLGRAKALHAAEIIPAIVEINGQWVMELTTDRLAQTVEIDVEGFRPEDNGFHLAPGEKRQIRLQPLNNTPASQKPTGEIQALGNRATYRF